MDKIFIKDLLIRCIIGVNGEERRIKQDILINITLLTDLRKPGKSDKIDEAVDYRAIKKKVYNEIEISDYRLIESLAERVSEICLENSAVKKAIVKVEKPGALRFAKSVGVEITRERFEI